MKHLRSEHTPADLMNALVSDLEEMLKGKQFKNPDKGSDDKYIQIKVFEQNLPVHSHTNGSSDDAGIDYADDPVSDSSMQFPWCLVKADRGSIKGTNEEQTVEVAVCFGIFDDDPENNGHRDIMSLIMKTYQRYASNPVLAHNFRCDSNFEWAPQEDDTWPYFFGAIGMTFKFGGVNVEDKFA